MSGIERGDDLRCACSVLCCAVLYEDAEVSVLHFTVSYTLHNSDAVLLRLTTDLRCAPSSPRSSRMDGWAAGDGHPTVEDVQCYSTATQASVRSRSPDCVLQLHI